MGCPAVLAVLVFGACCVNVGHGFSSAVACPVEVFSCLGSDECTFCLDGLQDAGLNLGGIDFELCGELYADVCGTADSVGCNTENEELVELLTCIAEDQYSCDDFTTCEEATAGLIGAAGTPAPSIAAATAVPAPASPTFPTPVFPLSSAAPSSGSRGNFLPPTTAPTAGVSETFGTAFPSPAVFEGTMAPSESSAAPTTEYRGGIWGSFSASPTAAPTGFEGLDDSEDAVSGGLSSRYAADTAARYAVVATVLAGFCSSLAALAA